MKEKNMIEINESLGDFIIAQIREMSDRAKRKIL